MNAKSMIQKLKQSHILTALLLTFLLVVGLAISARESQAQVAVSEGKTTCKSTQDIKIDGALFAEQVACVDPSGGVTCSFYCFQGSHAKISVPKGYEPYVVKADKPGLFAGWYGVKAGTAGAIAGQTSYTFGTLKSSSLTTISSKLSIGTKITTPPPAPPPATITAPPSPTSKITTPPPPPPTSLTTVIPSKTITSTPPPPPPSKTEITIIEPVPSSKTTTPVLPPAEEKKPAALELKKPEKTDVKLPEKPIDTKVETSEPKKTTAEEKKGEEKKGEEKKVEEVKLKEVIDEKKMEETHVKLPSKPIDTKIEEEFPLKEVVCSDITEKTKNYKEITEFLKLMHRTGTYLPPKNQLCKPSVKTKWRFAVLAALTLADENCGLDVSTLTSTPANVSKLRKACMAKAVELDLIDRARKGNITKAELIELIMKSANLALIDTSKLPKIACHDIDPDSDLYELIQQAQYYDLVKTYKFKGKSGFCLPNAPSTHADALHIAWKAMQKSPILHSPWPSAITSDSRPLP